MTKPEKVDDAIIEDHKQIGSDACHNSSTQIDANPCKVPDMQTPQFPSIFYFHSRDQASSMASCQNRKTDNNVLHCAYTLCHDELEPSLHSDLERKVDIDMAIFNAEKDSSPMQNEFDEEFGLAEIYKGTHGYPVSSKTSRSKESARHHGTCSNAMAKYTGNFCITRPTQTHTDEDVWRLSSANGFTKVAPMLCLQDGPAESVDEQMQYGYSDQDIEMEGLQSMIERFFNHKDLQPASTTITSAPSQQAHHRSSHHNHRNQEAGDVISYQATKTEESAKILERSTRPLGTCEVAHEIESLSGSFNLQYLQAQYIANCLS
ncbi:hypothetical protein KP509_1Z300300 [Ceratopteris richardii]|nr:hypothetical protein KP509_1Z300300 [Ceratopteris richardii]